VRGRVVLSGICRVICGLPLPCGGRVCVGRGGAGVEGVSTAVVAENFELGPCMKSRKVVQE
jgi:hypothetical protein